MIRAWLLPLTLGGLAAGLVFVLPSPDLDHEPLPTPVDEPLGLAWAFGEAVAPANGTATLFAVGTPDARSLPVSCPDGARDLPLARHTDALWSIDVPAGCATPDGILRVHAAVNATAFGPSRDAVQVTVFVFEEHGELVASDAGATSRNRYRLYGDFVTLSHKPWFLGDGPVPEGMRAPRGYEAFARDRLSGVPVGGGAWAHVPVHEYDWLTGPLWVVARIDALP